MSYLYHIVPSGMRGNVLYPLNVLKKKYPDIYRTESAKYAGRESIMQTYIPNLDCLWGDVLHLSPVHPEEIQHALNTAGVAMSPLSYYEIEESVLDKAKALIWTNTENRIDVIPYTLEALEKYSHVPLATEQYYREVAAQGEPPLLYQYVPHVLYKGEIVIGGVKIIAI